MPDVRQLKVPGKASNNRTEQYQRRDSAKCHSLGLMPHTDVEIGAIQLSTLTPICFFIGKLKNFPQF